MARGLRDIRSHAGKGEASSHHEAMSPQQMQQTSAPTQHAP